VSEQPTVAQAPSPRADPDGWAPCAGHPPQATAGPAGCSDHWPPPDDTPPGDASARLAEASAALGTLEAAAAACQAGGEDPDGGP